MLIIRDHLPPNQLCPLMKTYLPRQACRLQRATVSRSGAEHFGDVSDCRGLAAHNFAHYLGKIGLLALGRRSAGISE
jgi:hypothetical protein